MTTREEIDVVSCSPALSLSSTSEIRLPDLPEEDEMMEVENAENVYLNEEEKKYYCQRCLNHGMHYPRKGHKPKCKFLNCTCDDCQMVEQRRQLNNLLSRKKVRNGDGDGSGEEQTKGPRIRDPQCARCGAHGVKVPLRGHKKTMCQFSTCTCSTCLLVENRRTLMAKQIKLRRDQQKGRGIGTVAAAKTKAAKKVAAERPRRSGSTNSSPSSTESLSPIGPQSPTLPIPLPIIFPPPAPAVQFPFQINSAFSPVLPPPPVPFSFTPEQQLVILKMFIDYQQLPHPQ